METRPVDGRPDAPMFEAAAWGLTSQERELSTVARELGQSRFAERAAGYDREASFPTENYRDMHEAGLLGICIPRADGGEGAPLKAYALAAAEIGRYCGSTALTWNMHVSSCLWSGALSDDLEMDDKVRRQPHNNRAVHYRRILDEGAVSAQPFSECGAAAAGAVAFGTTASRTDGGWLVNGQKIFASLAGSANYYGALCTELKYGNDRPSRRNTLYLAIPADVEGVSVEGDWDPLGMRGTNSKNLLFEDAFVPAEYEFLPPGCFDQMATRWPYLYMTLSFTYLGIQRAVLDYTAEALRGDDGPVERRDLPQKQHGWAQMRLAWERSQALTYRVLGEVGVDPGPDRVERALAATVTAMETAPEVAATAVRVCGGRSLLRPSALERMYRDARCGATMLPWSVEAALDRLGRAGLYD